MLRSVMSSVQVFVKQTKGLVGGVLDGGEGGNASNKPACKDCILNINSHSIHSFMREQRRQWMEMAYVSCLGRLSPLNNSNQDQT